LIEFKDVTKTYGEDPAVSGFSLIAPSGKITVLMGLSGSGNTTLLRAVNKLVQPTAGSVPIDGNDIANLDSVVLRRPIGYVMQEVGLLPRKSVLDNVTLIANIADQTKDEALNNALEL